MSQELEGLLLTALAADRNDRYASAAEMLEDLGVLIVREGHRANNHTLADFVQNVIDQVGRKTAKQGRSIEERSPTSVVVLAVEAAPPPRSMGQPVKPLSNIVQAWMQSISQAGGEIWEHGSNSFLVCWVAKEGLKTALKEALKTAVELRDIAQDAGYRVSAVWPQEQLNSPVNPIDLRLDGSLQVRFTLQGG